MFGSSNLFGQPSTSSPFGTQTQPMFGQSSNTSTNNPFAPKPFGSTSTPFGAQTGSSIFGGTSTGVFGAPQTSSPFGSASSIASSAPAFGSSNSPFGGTSTFGQKSFGFSTPQSSAFGTTTQQSQPAFGNTTFGASSTPAFGASSTPAFGASSTPAFGNSTFGASSTPAFGNSTFGASSTPAFGASSTPAFGASNTSPFGASNTSPFGSSNTPAFGASNTPAFGANSTPAFGSTNTPAFGASSTPSFGNSSSPAFGMSPAPAFGSSGTTFGNNAFGSGGVFGASSTPAFGASSTPAFGFGSSPAFGQSNSTFGSTQSPFGAQGAQGSVPTFGGQSTIGGQQGGSRVMPYTHTIEAETGTGNQPAGKLLSISAMPVYKEKNHEELRWEDYQRGDKGGQIPSGQSPGGSGFNATNSQPSIFLPSQAFSQPSTNPTNLFSNTKATNSFAPKPSTTTSNFSSPFQTTTPSYSQTTVPSMFGTTATNSTSVFGSSSAFATTTSQPFSSPIFSSAPANGSTPGFSSGGIFNNSQSSPLFSSNSSFSQNTTPAFAQTGSVFAQNTNPALGQSNLFSKPSNGFPNLSSSSPSLTTSISPFSQTMPPTGWGYPSAQPTQQSGALGQTQIANTTGFTGGMGSFNQGNFTQVPALGNSAVMQPILVTNPFGTLPEKSMAETLLSFGFEKLWDLIFRESERFQGVEEQFNGLKSELETLRGFLKDADAKKHTSAMVKNTVKEIKEIVYDAEDIIETFLLKEELCKISGIKKRIRKLACVIADRRGLAFDMEALSKRITKVIRDMQILGVQHIIVNETDMQSLQERQRVIRHTFSSDNEDHLVGLEKDIEQLVGYLVEEDRSQVVSITGMGGIGKTTLARQVFNHETVKSHFAGLAWVCVSQQFTRKYVWQTILRKLRPHQVLEMTEDELQENLVQVLETQKALIVLDDIWREEDWDIIKPIFPRQKGWKILLTSRNEGVALRADPTCFTFRPDYLTPEESWTLFQRIVFPRDNTTQHNADEEMEEMGKQMVKHCGGLPLAVKVLGGLLAAQYTLCVWKRVYENIGPHIIGETSFSDKNISSVYQILYLSFEEMPIYLKHCFLYLAHFPEDYTIDVGNLFYYWAAEGIPRPRYYDGASDSEVADGYIEELVKRNMVISERDIMTSRFETCHLHDMMREVCLRKAEEENFVQIVDASTNSQPPCTSRRLVIDLPSHTFNMKVHIPNPKLRSLLFIK